MADKALTIADVADTLGVNPRTLRRYVGEECRHWWQIGRTWRIWEADLKKWVKLIDGRLPS